MEPGACLVYTWPTSFARFLPTFTKALPNSLHCHCEDKASNVHELINLTNVIPLGSSRLALDLGSGGF